MKKAVHRISIKGICASAAVFLLAAAVMLCVLRPGVTGTGACQLMVKLREGRYGERNPGGVSFTSNKKKSELF